MAVNVVDEVPTDSPMDSSITDMIMNMIGQGGAANAGAPRPPGGVSVSSEDSPALNPAVPPTPMNNAAPNAPMPMPRPPGAPHPVMPPRTTGPESTAQLAPQVPALTMQDLTRRGALQQYLPDVINAFLPTPEASGGGGGSASGSANAAPVGPPVAGGSLDSRHASLPPDVPMPRPRPGGAPPPPRVSGPESTAPLAASPGSMPAGASWTDIIKNALGKGGAGVDENAPAYGGKSVLTGILTGLSPNASPAQAASKPDSVLDGIMRKIGAGGAGSANAAGGPKDTGTTGDSLAAARQGQKIGPPNTQEYKATDSGRYSRPYAKGGVKEGQKRPMPKKPRASAGRSSSGGTGMRKAGPPTQSRQASLPSLPRAGQAPQTARNGRSAFAQSLIDSMGPDGVGVTTYIEPATGNEILTGGPKGLFRNLGKTSTGTQKPAFTKFFNN